jgi:hypothetical protein
VEVGVDDGPEPRRAPEPSTPHLNDVADHQVLHEGVTMALYVAVSLLALLTALPESLSDESSVLRTILGTTLGLALAHWLAFRVSSLFVGHGVLEPAARRSLGVQALAAAGVGAVAAAPLLIGPGPAALGISRLLLAGVIGLFAYGVSIQAQPSRLRGLVYALVVVVIALTVAIVKNLLAGH